ncbi:iron complex outermembrane receptor protein [Natronospira proteinivora]|uniref:Iron complex outermembrane receptor protein n=1 Tax=Natronospira proteinivora TaxID=1807133 RepID=A0ABT1G4B7_9GAMM|nr:TonB-dependent receptor [Natronospira proteinivora]MCP1726137.1 iron complex outermembrane receptor protein [Natronospira proteinivora]
MASFNVRNAVRFALGAGMAAAMTAPAAVAQEEEGARELDRVQVTGSRISRTQLEGATPVVTIDREDLDGRGYQNVADVLRNTSFNTAGSFREDSGTTWQGQATLNLRGIGSNRTLVLLNGRRMPGSPVMDGQTQNLNAIPFAAVERIEVLSDGASAIYGSDAIGGVVNVILRSDYEGVEISARTTFNERDGGEENSMSVIGGASGPRGNITFGLEWDETDIIFSRDRHFFAAEDFNEPGGNDWAEVTGLSEAARNILGADGVMRPMVDGDCSVYGDNYPDTIWDLGGGDTACGYNHTASSAGSAALDRTSVFLDANYEINPDIDFYARANHMRVESFGRYAAAAGAFAWNGPALAEEQLEDGQTLTELNPGDQVWYRFDNTGPSRDSYQNDYQTDLQFGFEGRAGALDWEVGYQYNMYDMHEWGTGYVNTLGLDAAGDAGWDPRQPDQEQFSELVDDMTDNANRRSQATFQRVDFGLQFDGPDLTGGPMAFFVGGEYFEQDYTDVTAAQAEADNILGTAGGSSGGSRDVSAVYGETVLPLTDTVELDFALRYDDYSDFGDNVSGKIGARWQPNRNFILRGSASQGFRAPSLDNLFQAPSQGFAFAQDIPRCIADGNDIATCAEAPTTQTETFTASNEDLEAEESTQFMIGTVFDFSDFMEGDLSLSIDYYNIEIDNQITSVSTQDAFWLEYLGQMDTIDGVSIERAGGGGPGNTPTRAEVGPINYEDFDTSGLDFNVRYGTELGNFGRLTANVNLNYVLEYNSRYLIQSEKQDFTDVTQPEWRADSQLNWRYGDHGVTLSTMYIPGRCVSSVLDESTIETEEFFATCATDGETGEDRELGGWVHHNLTYDWHTPWDGRVTVGVNNLTDKDPALNRNKEFSNDLYPFVGRQYVLGYTQNF